LRKKFSWRISKPELRMMGGRRTLSMMVFLKLTMFWTTTPGETRRMRPMTMPVPP
jgi:hypothetical protein